MTSILRTLAELQLEVAAYLEQGTLFDKHWAMHLRSDALSIQALALSDRHLAAPEKVEVMR